METVTYGDPKVAALIGGHFVAIRADQDASPELSSRYGDWGWPATIILSADGTELAKLRGFIEPDKLAALLQAFVDDPTPGPSAFSIEDVAPAPDALLGAPARAAMKKAVDRSFDSAHGGWGRGHRYIDADSLDLALIQAETGDGDAAGRARKTLDAARALIDPVWGGVYQYSDKDDWSSPHFEKLMAFQGQYLRQYSEAFARWRDPADLAAATAIKTYMAAFLRDPQGAFYVSQDADLDARTDGHAFYALDDSGRRRLGVPRIDKAIYASANGDAIGGLAAFFDAAGDRQALDMAVEAAQWIKAHRAIEGGGFSHSGQESDGPFLADNLAMGQAFIDLYAATGERSWLQDAAATGRFIAAHFREPNGGFTPVTAGAIPVGALSRPIRQLDDQIAVARFMNRLNRYTGEKDFAALADHAMRYAIASARGNRAAFAGSAARRPRTQPRADPYHHRGTEGRRAGAGAGRAGKSLPGALQATGLVGQARGAAAQSRHLLSGDGPAGGFRLRRPHLLPARLHGRTTEKCGRAHGAARPVPECAGRAVTAGRHVIPWSCRNRPWRERRPS